MALHIARPESRCSLFGLSRSTEALVDGLHSVSSPLVCPEVSEMPIALAGVAEHIDDCEAKLVAGR